MIKRLMDAYKSWRRARAALWAQETFDAWMAMPGFQEWVGSKRFVVSDSPPTAAPATGPNTTALDMSIYTTDEYPREGCMLRITVSSRPGGRYVMGVKAPNDGFIECYLADSPQALGRMVREWCEGRKPKMYDRSDQVAVGS